MLFIPELRPCGTFYAGNTACGAFSCGKHGIAALFFWKCGGTAVFMPEIRLCGISYAGNRAARHFLFRECSCAALLFRGTRPPSVFVWKMRRRGTLYSVNVTVRHFFMRGTQRFYFRTCLTECQYFIGLNRQIKSQCGSYSAGSSSCASAGCTNNAGNRHRMFIRRDG